MGSEEVNDSDAEGKQTRRVMLDIETLGTEPGCAILSIGAVEFGPDGLGKEFYRSVDLGSCLEVGLDIDPETLEWWLTQPDDLVAEQLVGGVPLYSVLSDLGSWLYPIDEIWANSPKFDASILEAAYEAIDESEPWEYYELRDFRTLKNLPPAPDIEREGTEHDALADAKHQARVASDTLHRVKMGVEA